MLYSLVSENLLRFVDCILKYELIRILVQNISMKYTGLIVLFAPVLLQAQGFADTGYLHYSFDASPQRKFTLHITKSLSLIHI